MLMLLVLILVPVTLMLPVLIATQLTVPLHPIPLLPPIALLLNQPGLRAGQAPMPPIQVQAPLMQQELAPPIQVPALRCQLVGPTQTLALTQAVLTAPVPGQPPLRPRAPQQVPIPLQAQVPASHQATQTAAHPQRPPLPTGHLPPPTAPTAHAGEQPPTTPPGICKI